MNRSANTSLLDPDRLLPIGREERAVARRLFEHVETLPIISPHGHTDPAWFAEDLPFPNPAELLLTPDHYVLRMFYSQGIPLTALGIAPAKGEDYERDPKRIWRLFAEHYDLFLGTPSRIWMDYVFYQIFGLTEPFGPDTAESSYEHIQRQLDTPAFKPRALFDGFGIEVLSTTDSPLDDLNHHQTIRSSEWGGRVLPAFRPDEVVDPEHPAFQQNLQRLQTLTGERCEHFGGYLTALRARRAHFAALGATSTDHGHPTANTENLSPRECETLYQTIRGGDFTAHQAEVFRGQMLTEMAAMSVDDGLVMQLHPGSWRNHNDQLFAEHGRDKGADIPMQTGYVGQLKPLLDRFGNHRDFTLILFTLDETAYSRELAPLAGHYPALRLGPPWWFHDSPNGMRRFREMTTETAGFYNTVGFNDDTRAFLSIPARHDLARRMDCGFLASLVLQHQMTEEQAYQVASDLSYGLAKRAYRL